MLSWTPYGLLPKAILQKFSIGWSSRIIHHFSKIIVWLAALDLPLDHDVPRRQADSLTVKSRSWFSALDIVWFIFPTYQSTVLLGRLASLTGFEYGFMFDWFSSSFLKPFPFIYKGKILSERPNELVMPCGFILMCVHSLFICFMEIYRFILPSNTLSSSTDREIKFLLFTFTQKTFSKNFPAFVSKYALDLYFTQIMSIGGETLNLTFYEPYLDTVPLLFDKKIMIHAHYHVTCMGIIEVPASVTLCLAMWYVGDAFHSMAMREKLEGLVKQFRRSCTSVPRQYITS